MVAAAGVAGAGDAGAAAEDAERGASPHRDAATRRHRDSDMYESRLDTPGPGCVRVRACSDGKPLTYREAVDLWINGRDFRAWFARLLIDAPFEAYCWETPPVSRRNLDRGFEFVLVDSPALRHLAPDPQPFQAQFAACEFGSGVATFPNLGADALLVVPLPSESAVACHSHLASFMRSAPESQSHALWQAVGAAIAQRLSDDPLWVSTAGLGVSWLHVRLDTRPKYYRFSPYQSAA